MYVALTRFKSFSKNFFSKVPLPVKIYVLHCYEVLRFLINTQQWHSQNVQFSQVFLCKEKQLLTGGLNIKFCK